MMRDLIVRTSLDFDSDTFRARWCAHVRRWGLAYLLVATAAAAFDATFRLGVNISPSLPYRLYLIHKGKIPTAGELVAFRWAGGGPYPAGTTFVKILAGMPGDAVTRADQDFFVNARNVGTAKPSSRTGTPLQPGPVGVLPPESYYVQAPHPDSLDSRYALTGWVSRHQIIGRAYAIF